jgi:hypothetical protein
MLLLQAVIDNKGSAQDTLFDGALSLEAFYEFDAQF